MLIRIARADELPALVQHSDQPERNDGRAAYLTDLLTKRCTRPEWCMVAEDEAGRLTAATVLWTLPGREIPMALVLLEAPWGEPGLVTGRALLAEAVALAGSLGATALEHVTDSPTQAPQYQAQPERRAELLRLAGFERARDGRRFRRRPGPEPATHDSRLTWRSLPRLGCEPFISLLAEALPTSADAQLAARVATHGARRAAESLFADMEEFSYEPSWWEIGYTTDGTPAALSLPARNPSTAVIGLVAVSPACRGNGYATAVVARGTRLLVEAGADEIRGDCDAANTAMIMAFERAGYENFADRQEFTRQL
ncbi:GNAT family N-acetyltransferase [Streptomyces sp. col6]|uniref:GNAT family N-acetyltransferase n=1 Tax=Streptomyces sp. col6 TaxID=2478958 RepID=UPI0011CEB3E8|nr:GNAT family N-acetyltransferase [Streptomyces sp. col6]TXS04808.1 GNAT family N-acetyltransferase [Streptomyces sp. col6]